MWIIMPLCPLPWSHLHIYLSRKTHIHVRQFLRNWVGLGYFCGSNGVYMAFTRSMWLNLGLFLRKSPLLALLWLFSHDGKVRILNFNSKCAFLITQCTHDRSTCVFWITQYTHERSKQLEIVIFLSRAWRRGIAVSGFPANQTRTCCLCFLCMCSALYYRRKWLEGHTRSAPQNTI